MGSSRKKCDIAIYETDAKEDIIGIVETKAPTVGFNKGQLESYMSATVSCRWGVWTNGEETHVFQRKNNQIISSPAFSVPPYGQRTVSIRRYDDLRAASNLKWVFRQINNRLYANTNLVRSDKQGAEMVRLIFCKLADEYNCRRHSKQSPAFQILGEESEAETRKRINALWKKTKEGSVGSPIFENNEEIKIDDFSLQLIISMLQGYSLLKTDRDVVGDAFEVFAERQFAGDKGQFFTPRPVVRMVVDMLNPTEDEKIMDPACGSGGFLIAALNHIAGSDVAEGDISRIAEHSLYGMDKDADLSKICKAQMSILGDGKTNIKTGDSLKGDKNLPKFDVVMTNPPFGSTIKVEHPDILKRYDLGHAWTENRDGEHWEKQTKTKPTPPQVLFIEHCVRLLKPGGRLGIVLPDGLLGNTGDGYIRQWISEQASVLAVVDCPTATFMPHTGTKTSVLLLEKSAGGGNVRPFMAIAEHCGHTMRGAEIRNRDGTSLREDFTAIKSNYLNSSRTRRANAHLGFFPPALRDGILVPRYYDPRIVRDIDRLRKEGGACMVTMEELEERGDLQVKAASASAKSEEYAIDGEIRFVRTSNIAAYEVASRTQKMVSRDTYARYREKQDLRQNDILFVKDGDDKIGEMAILADSDDVAILAQTHFYKLRARNNLDPFLLLWLLSRPIVRRQIRQRVFNQSTLSTIGNRIYELQLPMPLNGKQCQEIAAQMRKLITERRQKIREIEDFVNG